MGVDHRGSTAGRRGKLAVEQQAGRPCAAYDSSLCMEMVYGAGYSVDTHTHTHHCKYRANLFAAAFNSPYDNDTPPSQTATAPARTPTCASNAENTTPESPPGSATIDSNTTRNIPANRTKPPAPNTRPEPTRSRKPLAAVTWRATRCHPPPATASKPTCSSLSVSARRNSV